MYYLAKVLYFANPEYFPVKSFRYFVISNTILPLYVTYLSLYIQQSEWNGPVLGQVNWVAEYQIGNIYENGKGGDDKGSARVRQLDTN